MKKIIFCLSLFITILSIASNIFANDISNNYDNTNDEINLTNIKIEEEYKDEETFFDSEQQYDIIISGSAIKFESIESSVRSSYPDLTITSLTSGGTYPFTALASSTFEFKLSNIGSAVASNIYIGIYIDDNLAGKVSIGSLSAGYTFNGNMNLSNVHDGTHAVKLVADVYNIITESNENNNTITKNFAWVGTPDLTATVINPLYTEISANKDTRFQFYVNNIGNGKGSGTIPVEILIDGNVLASLYIKPVTAKSQTLVDCTINFGYALGEYEVTIRVNNNKSFTESNYNNNSASRKYDITYCTHYIEDNKFPISISDNIKIQVKSSATDVFGKDIFFNISDWNGISDNVRFDTLVFSDGDNSANIIIEGKDLGNDVLLGQTHPGGTLIELNTGENSLPSRTENYQIRTFLHEVGHALGLNHPDVDCEYEALMWQTKDNLMTLNLTNHDRYNLIKLYE